MVCSVLVTVTFAAICAVSSMYSYQCKCSAVCYSPVIITLLSELLCFNIVTVGTGFGSILEERGQLKVMRCLDYVNLY